MKKLAGRFYIVLVLFASYYFTSLWFELNYEFRGAPWPALLNGTAPAAFQYRVLVPWLVNFLSTIRVGGSPIAPVSSLFFWIEFVSVCAFVFAFRYYLKLFFTKRLASLLSLSLFLVLPYNYLLDRFLALRYPTDLPSLLFFTLGLIFLYRKNWLLFYLIFIVGTFNRETTCFLTAAYFFTAIGSERPKTISTHILCQALIWLGIKYWLYRLYILNPREMYYALNIAENIQFLTTPVTYPMFFSNLGYLWIPTLIFWRLIPDPFVKRTVWLIPLFFLGMFFIGNFYEFRIFGELIPIVLSAFLLILKQLFIKETAIPPHGGGA